jgi:hydrogenase-4 component B
MSLDGAVLALLALVLAGLLALGVAGAVPAGRRSRRPRMVMAGTAALCGLAALAVLLSLLAGAPRAGLALPVGLPGLPMTLVIDPLSALFLLLVFGLGAAASAAALDPHGAEDARSLPFHPVFIAAMALTLLAGDGWTLVFGFELMSLASWAMVLARHEEEASRTAAVLYLGMAAIGAACLIPAFGLLSMGGLHDLSFAALRARPHEGWRVTAVLALVLLGAGSKAGLFPLHVWLPLAHPAAPSHGSALMSGAMTKVAIYVIIRFLFDLCGPAQPSWWGVPLLLAGAASAVLGALRANMEGDLKSVLAASTVENIGLIAIGLGVALAARGADLPTLAAFALGAALVHALLHGMFKTLLFLGAGAAQHGAGTRLLSRLGGLIHRMPWTTGCMLVGGAALSGLPPGPGFAGEWMLFQSLLAAPRIGGLLLQTVVTVAAAAMALAVALAAAAAVRLIGVAFLGRPRSPRGAAAEEAPRATLYAMGALAGVAVLFGLLPGLLLDLAAPALRGLAGMTLADRANLVVVAPQAQAPGYSPVGIALLLGAALGATVWVVRRYCLPGERRAPAWDCGFAAPPQWLPFGDPSTQYGGASFAQPLRRSLGATVLAARERIDMPEPEETRPAGIAVTMEDPAAAWLFAPVAALRERLAAFADRMQLLTVRRALVVLFVALVLLLLILAWVENV